MSFEHIDFGRCQNQQILDSENCLHSMAWKKSELVYGFIWNRSFGLVWQKRSSFEVSVREKKEKKNKRSQAKVWNLSLKDKKAVVLFEPNKEQKQKRDKDE